MTTDREHIVDLNAPELVALRAATEEAEWARNSGDGSVATDLVDALTEAVYAALRLIDREATP